MPLRCLDPTGRSIHSIDLTDDQWRALELENRKGRHLRMPCCSSPVTLKRSHLGTPFFAHKAVGVCTTAAETEEHRHLKRMVMEAARANGWTADTEVTGTSPSGDEWRADVLARKGKHKVAVEVQWSNQTNADTLRRQRVYKEAGIRGLWLLRQPGFPVTRELPAACIGGSLKEGFSALIPDDESMSAWHRSRPEEWHQVVPMEEFLDAAFGERFWFGVRADTEAIVFVYGTSTYCWHENCKAPTRIITNISVVSGPDEFDFSIPDLSTYQDLVQHALDRLPGKLGIGEIKPRYSSTQRRAYLSNGCSRCNRIFGEFYNFGERSNETLLASFSIRLSERWLQAIDDYRGARGETAEDGWAWGVHRAAGPAGDALPPPSAERCSDCGHVMPALLPANADSPDREWVCPACGCVHDRAGNAAKNLEGASPSDGEPGLR